MLPSKFQVLITHNILKRSSNVPRPNIRRLSKKQCPTDKPSCNPREKTGGRIIRNRAAEYKAALEKCPKEPVTKTHCKKLFADPPPTCASNTVSDEYREAYKIIKDRTLELTKFVKKTANRIKTDMDTEIEANKAAESTKMQAVMRTVEAQMVDLCELDLTCGSAKKHQVQRLSDRVRQEMKIWQCGTEPRIEEIKTELEKVQHDAALRSNAALALILCCRNCKSPQALADCVKRNVKEALRIMDKANIDVQKKLNHIKESKDTAVRDSRRSAQEIFNAFADGMGQLSRHLSDCIDGIKKLQSTRK